MPLSVNVADVWKFFQGRKNKEKDEIIEWLEAAAKEARQLVQIWVGMRDEINGKQHDATKAPYWESIAADVDNFEQHSRLRQFYDDMSLVLEGRIRKSAYSEMRRCLAQFMWGRERTRVAYTATFRQIREAYFLDDASSYTDLHDLDEAIKVLKREAVAFEQLVRQFKATSNRP